MTASEMFEKLGYTRNLDSKKIIYSKELKGMFRYFEITFDLTEKEVELYDDYDAYTINNALLKAIQQQLKELGWLEEEKKTETNFEHYKDEIIEGWMLDLALVDGKLKRCSLVDCDECEFNPGANKGCKQRLIEWVKMPYEKPKYKLNRFECDLLNAYKNSGMRQCISNYGTLLELYKKGYFKDIGTNIPICEILDNCKVV